MKNLVYLYQESRFKSDADGAVLETYPPSKLVKVIKERAPLAEHAAVVLLHVFLDRQQLPEYFTSEEISRYFSKLPR